MFKKNRPKNESFTIYTLWIHFSVSKEKHKYIILSEILTFRPHLLGDPKHSIQKSWYSLGGTSWSHYLCSLLKLNGHLPFPHISFAHVPFKAPVARRKLDTYLLSEYKIKSLLWNFEIKLSTMTMAHTGKKHSVLNMLLRGVTREHSTATLAQKASKRLFANNIKTGISVR